MRKYSCVIATHEIILMRLLMNRMCDIHDFFTLYVVSKNGAECDIRSLPCSDAPLGHISAIIYQGVIQP